MSRALVQEALSRPLKILHVVSYFPPDRVGGVGEVAAYLHQGLLERGHDSHVLTTGTSSDDSRVHRVVARPGGFSLATLLQHRLVRDFDIVHAQHGEALPLLAAARLATQSRLLLTLHVSNREISRSNRQYSVDGHRFRGGLNGLTQAYLKSHAKSALDSAALRLADRVSFISHSGAREVLGPKAGTAAVIHNALPELGPREVQPTPEHIELLYVGTPGQRKRTELLPLILHHVRRDRPNARLRIVGFSLPDHPSLAHRFAELNLTEAVVSEGSLVSSRLDPFYRAADVLIVPSAYEGLPMVILEALQRGLPCVATDVGGNSEAVEHGTTGFLVRPDSPQEMATRCVELLANPSTARSMGSAGAAVVAARFGLDRQLDEYTRLYTSMVESGR